MYNIWAMLLPTLSCLSLVTATGPEHQTPLGLLEVKHTLRPLAEDDLDDMVTTALDAFGPSPAWQYVHYDVDKYYNYTWDCVRKSVQQTWEFVKRRDKAFINVIVVPQDGDEALERSERAVSYAAWGWLDPDEALAHQAVPFSITLHSSHNKCSDELNTNKTREEDWQRQFEAEERRVGANVTDEPQLYLFELATHPDWDGHGFAAEQVEVGQAQAALAKMPVYLTATEAGYPVYDSVDFRSLGNMSIKLLDDLGIVWFEYMRWETEQ